MDSYMITSNFLDSSNAENKDSKLITEDASSILLNTLVHQTTKLVDSFHGVLVLREVTDRGQQSEKGSS